MNTHKISFSIKALIVVVSTLTSHNANASIAEEFIGGAAKVVKKLLVMNVSPNLTSSNSRVLSQHFLDQLNSRYPGKYEPMYRDLGREPVPYINNQTLEVILAGTALTPEAESLRRLSDTLINELKTSDAIVIATPMHNFTIPAPLKSYIDLILRAGKTFGYTSSGPQGMLEDRPVMLITTSGGCYGGTSYDHLTPYMRTTLGFIGIRNVTAVNAEGLAMQDKKDTSLISAMEELTKQSEAF